MNKANIYNLKELDRALKEKSEEVSYDQILDSIRFSFKDIEHLCFWDADDYSKINVVSDLDYELVLICWEKSQQSKIHKHSSEEALTYVLKGELTEDLFDADRKEGNPVKTQILEKKDVSRLLVEEGKEHQLTNSYKGRTVSLHLYIKK